MNRFERAALANAVRRMASHRGPAWLVSVLRPTGAQTVDDLPDAALGAIIRVFETGVPHKPGVVAR